jgi:hypothetical protein
METLVHRYWWTWLIQWCVLMALWFAFVWKVEAGEALVGIAAAALAASGDAAIRRRRRFAKFKPAPAWLAQFWREPGYVVSGSAIIFWVLLRRLILGKEPDSVLRSIPFDAAGSTARAAARRALALILTTIPPNFIVIGIDEKEGSMLVHQVQESDVPEVAKRLGAR